MLVTYAEYVRDFKNNFVKYAYYFKPDFSIEL